MSRVDEAVSQFKAGLCCSQAILCAYGPSFGMDHDTACRLSAGFGGGMGRMAGTCGAVTGAYMVLGLASDAATATQGRAKVYEIVRQFAGRFAARNGSVTCKDLMGCDISTPEGAKQFAERRYGELERGG
jgi:C_GCAxxG_C_C family probable redox protein